MFDLHDWIWSSLHIRPVSHAHDGRDRMGSRDVCFGDGDPKFVVGSNFCDIGFDLDNDNNRLIALSASDNLMKGAAGSAVQNMNVMSGFDEKQGIMYSPLTPV